MEKIKMFDDDLNINFFKIYLKTLKSDFENIKKENLNANKHTRLYVNSLRFEKISRISSKKGKIKKQENVNIGKKE